MNPPFNDPERQNVSPDAHRRLAHLGSREMLAAWMGRAHALLAPAGTLTLIWRADRLAEVLGACAGFGAITLLPVHPRPDAAAIRIIVRAVKASRAPLTLLPGLTLEGRGGKPSVEAEAVLRDAAALPMTP